MSVNSFGARLSPKVGGTTYEISWIDTVTGHDRLPCSLKILLENLLRTEDGVNIIADDIRALGDWDAGAESNHGIQFAPAHVIMQDFTDVSCVVDLTTMREAVTVLGGGPAKVNPLSPVEMAIDHSVMAEVFGAPVAFARNTETEYQRNQERYQFLRWDQTAFDDFKVVPPGTDIVHQVNVEHLARVVFPRITDGVPQAYPDTHVGTDPHTAMVNGFGVVGWGVGGIEAEAAMLGQPVSMLIPRVVGFKLTGRFPEGTTSTDLVLTITKMLRRHKVVGKFVEFYDEGVSQVPLANRATIRNMSPEYGSTIAVFPIDGKTIDYLRLTGHDEAQIALVEAYAKAQGLWHLDDHEPDYSEYIELDLRTVVPSVAGPKCPQDRILLTRSRDSSRKVLSTYTGTPDASVPVTLTDGTSFELRNGAITIASITSYTNTSNPSVTLGAALVAKKAVERGMTRKPWVKTSLAPGPQVVTDHYTRSGLGDYLDAIGFNLVGYGCVACIGNTGPLIPEVSTAVNEHGLAVVAVLSGNRNFEGRIGPDVKMSYLASPMLVIIYALAGTMDIDLFNNPISRDHNGSDVFMRNLWPTQAEIEDAISSSVSSEMPASRYANVFTGDECWRSPPTPNGAVFEWDGESTYIRRAPCFNGMPEEPIPAKDIGGARVLLKLGDSVTTDHISPAGSVKPGSPTGAYLASQGVGRRDFSPYGSRRGNHEIMIRDTFTDIRPRNQVALGTEGGFTRDLTLPGAPVTTAYDATQNYAAAGIPLVILADKEYGSGSSRDWAAKGTAPPGVRAVVTKSYERIHCSNLIGMGVLPLQFPDGVSVDSFGLTGGEIFTVSGITELNSGITPRTVRVIATRPDGTVTGFDAIVRIDTLGERAYYLNDGTMPYVLRNLARV